MATEDTDAGTFADVVVADEADHPVPELGVPDVGVHETDRVGVGADDHDRPHQSSGSSELPELRAREPPLGEQCQERPRSEQHDPQPRELLELHEEGDDHQGAHPDGDGPQDVAGFLRRSLVRSREVHPVERRSDREARQADEPEEECRSSSARDVADEVYPRRGRDQGPEHRSTVGDEQTRFQVARRRRSRGCRVERQQIVKSRCAPP
jgi:hypothetical protein